MTDTEILKKVIADLEGEIEELVDSSEAIDSGQNYKQVYSDVGRQEYATELLQQMEKWKGDKR